MADSETQALLERLGRRVRALRRAGDWTAKETAQRAGLSPRFFSDLEAGRANIAVGRLAAVARALKVPLGELLTEPASGASAPRRSVIALLGLRGAGKSTLGRELARRLGLPFVELDERIEDAAGVSLAEVFALHGEPWYRRLTRRTLGVLVAEGAPAVVALPGGIVQDEEAFALIRRRCWTAWLKARPQDHMDRVVEQGDRRPMAGRDDAMAELRSILAEREPFYRRSDVSVDTSARDPGAAVSALVASLERAGWAAP